jgi:DivIVA domain-containing protein
MAAYKTYVVESAVSATLRGEQPQVLPADEVTPDDVRELKFQQVLRGYKMSEVDWVLQRLATEVGELRARVEELESSDRA